jgi:hypothetical protein
MPTRTLDFLRSLPVLSTLLLTAASSCASNASPPASDSQGPVSAQSSEVLKDADFTWSTELGEGARVEVYGIQGTIHVVPADGRKLEVRGKKSGSGDQDAVNVEVIEKGDKVVICTVYPGGRCDADGYHGGQNHKTDNVSVDLEVHLPSGAAVGAKTVNGSIHASGVTGTLHARTVNGNVELTASGKTDAETVNGSIAAVVPGSLDEDLHLNAVNGSLRVELPPEVNADLNAATVNGSIKSDFPLEYSGRMVGARASGKLGQGGPSVDLRTVNGAIHIRQDGKA